MGRRHRARETPQVRRKRRKRACFLSDRVSEIAPALKRSANTLGVRSNTVAVCFAVEEPVATLRESSIPRREFSSTAAKRTEFAVTALRTATP